MSSPLSFPSLPLSEKKSKGEESGKTTTIVQMTSTSEKEVDQV